MIICATKSARLQTEAAATKSTRAHGCVAADPPFGRALFLVSAEETAGPGALRATLAASKFFVVCTLRHVPQRSEQDPRLIVFQSRSKILRCKLRILADPANHRLVVRNTRFSFHFFSVLPLQSRWGDRK